MRRVHLYVAFALLALGGAATATHSRPACDDPVTTIGTGPAVLYYVDEGSTFWLYAETNGHPALQRGGAPWYGIFSNSGIDWCWDVEIATGRQIPDPDEIVY